MSECGEQPCPGCPVALAASRYSELDKPPRGSYQYGLATDSLHPIDVGKFDRLTREGPKAALVGTGEGPQRLLRGFGGEVCCAEVAKVIKLEI